LIAQGETTVRDNETKKKCASERKKKTKAGEKGFHHFREKNSEPGQEKRKRRDLSRAWKKTGR